MVNGFVSGFSMGAIIGFFSVLPQVGPQCFIAGTLVLTAVGHKKIEDIKVGDKVWAYDEKTKQNKLKKVVRLFRNKTKEWFHVFINKQEIVCTGEHPFYINNKGWGRARDLIENDEVIHYNEEVSKINKICKEVLDTPEDTYNFEVEDCHTYYVTDSDVLVHNKCAYDYLNEALKRQGLDSVPQEGLNVTWTEGNYKIQVRVHAGNPQYTSAKQIFRVSRHLEGSGLEYLGRNGVWYHTSYLKPQSRLFSEMAAALTHIPVI